MTAIVGVLCQDGVVVGSDSMATFGVGTLRTIEQPIDHKVLIIKKKLILAGTGRIGLGQRFASVLENSYEKKDFQGSAIDVGMKISQSAVKNFAATDAGKGQYGALLAFPLKGKAHLCEFAVADFQPELKDEHLWYCSMGSSQPITDPFLGFFREIYWEEGPPNVSEGVFVALWTLQLAIKLNPGGVGGKPVIAVLAPGKDGHLVARQLSEAELAEQEGAVEAATEHLRGFREMLREGTGEELPEPPA